MGPALRGAAVIQGGQSRPPIQSKTGTAQNGTSGTPSPTHSVIARSEATRQSVLPSPKRRIPAPVCTPRALASRRALARNDSAPRWERRDTWVPPYGGRRSSRADRVVRPYKAEQEPCETGRRGRRPLRNNKGVCAKGRTEASATTRQNRSHAKRDVGDAVPYGITRGVCAMGGQGRPPLQGKTGTARNGAAGTACPTNRCGAARTAKFRNFFFPLSASAGLRRLYSDDTGRPPVL